MKTKDYFAHTVAAFIFALVYDSIFARWSIQSYLIFVILVAVTASPRLAYLWSIILGVFLDSSLALPSGILLISLITTTALTHLCLNNFFTARSVHSVLILMPLSTLIFQLMRYLLPLLLRTLNIGVAYLNLDLFNAGKLIILNTITAVGLFLIYYFFRARWQNMFLTR